MTAARIDGAPAELLTRESTRSRALRADENDVFLLTAPDFLAPGSVHQVEFEHEGELITSPGNGVYSVGARSNWYPRSGSAFADYDLVFRYPKRLTLVTPGDIVMDHYRRRLADDRAPHARTHSRGRIQPGRLRKELRSPRAGSPWTSSETAASIRRCSRRRATTTVTRVIQHTPARAARGKNSPPSFKAVPPPDPLARLNAVATDVSACFQYFSGLFGPPPL